MDVQISSVTGVGKTLSKKNMTAMKDSIAAHQSALDMCAQSISDHTKTMKAAMKSHEQAISKMQSLVDEYENTDASSVVKIIP